MSSFTIGPNKKGYGESQRGHEGGECEGEGNRGKGKKRVDDSLSGPLKVVVKI